MNNILFECDAATRPSLMAIASRLLNTEAFQRLSKVTFLGILSPRFVGVEGHPLAQRVSKGFNLSDDGSRADHSIGVASLMLRFCQSFNFTERAAKYAVAWALVHDVATWPLSHTGEVAFARVTGLDHRSLRRKMILADANLPATLHLRPALLEMGVEPTILIQLLDKTSHALEGELLALHSVIHSAITPDTLEGIHRAAISIGMKATNPSDVLDAIDASTADMFNSAVRAVVRSKYSGPVLKFWRSKAEVYDDYINSPTSIEFESRWTSGIECVFGNIDLLSSLYLTEEEIIEAVSSKGLPAFVSIVRYKPPQRYSLHGALKNKRTLPSDRTVESLRQLLDNNEK